MNNILVVFAVGAAAAAGYLVGDGGSLTIAAVIVGALSLVALVVAWGTGGDQAAKVVSLRPANAVTPKVARPGDRKVLRPGELTRLREQERVLQEFPQVAVRLAQAGEKQIAVIKVLRSYLDIGLKEAKAFTDEAKKGRNPLVVASLATEHAKQFARDIEAAGGVVEFEEPVIR
jgi:ribosomal protein L7/L12